MIKSVWIATLLWGCCMSVVDARTAYSDELAVAFLTQNPLSKITDGERSEIQRANDPVWFDTTDGTVRPIPRGGSIYVDDRHDSVAGPAARSAPGWWSNFVKSIGDMLAWLFQGWYVVLIVCLIALLVLIVVAVFYVVMTPSHGQRSKTSFSRRELEKAKIQDLPFEVEQSLFGLLSQAERYRAVGDYSKAIIYLFSYALVEMDGARCIRLERGKTNRVYLHELKHRDGLRGFTTQIVVAFEYAFFGKHVLNQDSFERIWEQLPAFEAMLKQTAMPPSGPSGDTLAGGT